MKGIFNHMRCVDLLQSREEVDPARIGVIGHSLGGHNSMFVAAYQTIDVGMPYEGPGVAMFEENRRLMFKEE